MSRHLLNFCGKLYCQRFFQMRTGILLILLYGAIDMSYTGLDTAVRNLNYPSSPWFILNVMTNNFVCAAVGLGAVYLFSGAPYLNRNGMYQMIRMGKMKWAAVQLGSIVLSSFSLTMAIFLMGVLRLFPRIDFTLSWGKVIKTLALTNAATEFDVIFELNYGFLQQMEAWQAGILAFFMDSFVFMLLGFLLFSLGLCWGRTAALAVVSFLAVLPFADSSVNLAGLRMFHMLSPVSWLQTGLFGTKRLTYEVMPSMKTVFGMWGLYMGIAFLLTGYGLYRNGFQWNGEAE